MFSTLLRSLFSWANFWWALVTALVLYVVGIVLKASSRGSAPGKEQNKTESGADDEGEQQEEASADFGDSVRLKPQAPKEATGEIARILNARDFFAVMDVPRDSDAQEVKKAFRSKLLITHPDKNQGVVGALEASQRINAANDTLSDDVRRKQYYIRLVDEEQNGTLRSRGGAAATDLNAAAEMFYEYCKEAMGPPPPGATYPSVKPSDYDPWNPEPDHTFHMPCTCGFDHIARKVPNRSSSYARNCRCSSCGFMGMGTMLTARHDDVWFEAPNNFLRNLNPERFISAYRCVGTYVYDITDWCRCSGLLSDATGHPAPTNTHYVPFRMQGATGGKRSKASGSREGSGYNEFKGGGANSHKSQNRKKKKGRR